MSDIEISDKTISGVLDILRHGAWLTPEFQRDFVWNTNQVCNFIESILDAKPIGMVTLWAREKDDEMELEHISLPDSQTATSAASVNYFGNNDDRPGQFCAILDGKQRCTAIATVFGGLRPGNKKFKNCGRYFLDVKANSKGGDEKRVKFFKETEIEKSGLDKLSIAIAEGLFPLWTDKDEPLELKLMQYQSAIYDRANYPNGNLPDDTELGSRVDLLTKASLGIQRTKLATYVVPSSVGLDEICEVFELLNTTGTKVSTVDLIHSFLFSDTMKHLNEPIKLREKIKDLGEFEGAEGWATLDRPEIVAQTSATIYMSVDKKYSVRKVLGSDVEQITSIKSSNLLAVPYELWVELFENEELLASWFGDMQKAVAGSFFTYKQAPYPNLAPIYVGLRWYLEKEKPDHILADKNTLNSIFIPYFWRSAYSNRFDQGMLTTTSKDLYDIKRLLKDYNPEKITAWTKKVNDWLDTIVQLKEVENTVKESFTTTEHKGAIDKAAKLLIIGSATVDLLDPDVNIRNLRGSSHELHHILPRDWCKNNRSLCTQNFEKFKDQVSTSWWNMVANLMPLSKASNLKWKAKSPPDAIKQFDLDGDEKLEIFETLYVDPVCVDFLINVPYATENFLLRRGKLLTEAVIEKMSFKSQ